jgi:hypothetical protein
MLFLAVYIIQVYIQDNRYSEKVVEGTKIRVRLNETNGFALLLMLGLILPGILCMLQISILGLKSLIKFEYPMNMYFEMIYITSNVINSLI